MAVLIPNVSLVAGELQTALGLIQHTQAMGPALGSDQVLFALQAVERVPGAIAHDEVMRVRQLVQAGAPQEAFRVLVSHRSVLEAAAEQCRAPLSEAQDLPLARIAAVLGLPVNELRLRRDVPDYRPSTPAPPLAPAEAGRVELVFSDGIARPYDLSQIHFGGHCLALAIGRKPKNGGAELKDPSVSEDHAVIRFMGGVYTLENCGSPNDTRLNGRRLYQGERPALKDGDRVSVGRYEMTLNLPYARRLETLERRLQAAADFHGVFTTLEEEGFRDAVPRLREAVSSPAPVDERLQKLREVVPNDAGLFFKLESLMLRREAVLLRALYFPQARLADALALGEQLSRLLAQASSFSDLAERLRAADPETFRDLIEKAVRFASRREDDTRLSSFPRHFGLRDQVERVFWEKSGLPDDQKRHLHYNGVTPDTLRERPWRKIQVPSALEKALDPFRGAIGERLNLDAMERTVQTSFAEEKDDRRPSEEESPAQKTAHILYDRYQDQKPTTSQIGDTPTESRKPDYFTRVFERLRKDGLGVVPDGYWFFGGKFERDMRFDGRIYLSLRRRHSEAIFRYLHGVIAPALKGETQYKIAGNVEGYSRSDSGVVYFYAKDQKAVYRAVREMHRAHPEFFKEGHPLFTQPLRDEAGAVLAGLSFGQHPPESGQSFGSLRTNALTLAVRTARVLMNSAEPPDWSEIRQICAYFLSRAGVDLDNPAFQAGGREKFPEVAADLAAPIDHEAAERLIVNELLQRFPALHGKDFQTLVERLARDIFKSWRGSGLFPGQAPDAPAYVPEEFFEARVEAAIELMRLQNGPRTAFLAREMRASDQGPRVVRAVTARLRNEIPLLREEVFAKLVRAVADNVNRTWLAGDPTAEAFERVYQDYLKRLPAWIEANGAMSEPLRRLLAELRYKLPNF